MFSVSTWNRKIENAMIRVKERGIKVSEVLYRIRGTSKNQIQSVPHRMSRKVAKLSKIVTEYKIAQSFLSRRLTIQRSPTNIRAG